VGQLARGGKHVASGGTERAHHAIRVPVAVVWRRGDPAEGIDGGSAFTAGVATEERGAVSTTLPDTL